MLFPSPIMIGGLAQFIAWLKGYKSSRYGLLAVMLIIFGGAIGGVIGYQKFGDPTTSDSAKVQFQESVWLGAMAGALSALGRVLVLPVRRVKKEAAAPQGHITKPNGERDLVEEYRKAREQLYGQKNQ